jgi:Tfp pilus assembly protein PilV
MKKIITYNLFKLKSRGFTLVEALISTFVITSVVLGPLTVALDATSHARLTKDTMTATYLAQEGIELLRGQQDSVYMRCIQDTGSFCTLRSSETPSDAAWRMFRERLGYNLEGVSCFLNDNPGGCSYDYIDMTGDQSIDPPKYSSGASSCNTLSLSSDFTYVCTGVRGAGYSYRKFSRSIRIQSIQTFFGQDADYNDDLRVTATVTFRRPTGFTREIKFVDFLHARS